MSVFADRVLAAFSNFGRALRHRNYRLFFSGQIVSLIGTWMHTVAMSWLVWRLTGSPALLGAVAFATQAPVFFLSAFGGVVADRFDRRTILIATQIASMIVAAGIAAVTLLDIVDVWMVMAFATAFGLIGAVDVPTRQAFSIDMVGREDLSSAIALNSTMFNSARLVGPAIGGLVVAAVGEGWCFVVNAVSFMGVIVGLVAMRPPERPVEGPRSGSTWGALRDGFAFYRERPDVLDLLILVAAASLLASPVSTLLPEVVDLIHGAGADTLGFFLAAMGAGALMGSVRFGLRTSLEMLSRVPRRFAAFHGISVIVFANTGSIWIAALSLVSIGFCLVTQHSASNTLVQHAVPDRLRGRVMAVYSMAFIGLLPFGSLLAGAASEAIGPATAMTTGGVLLLAAALLSILREWQRRRASVAN